MNGFRRYGQVPQQRNGNLYALDANQMAALSQQGNLTHEQLLEMQGAQQGMREAAVKSNIEVPKVNFYPSRHPDSRKARKKDIKQARKLLRPSKRSIFNPLRWLGMKYRYNKQHERCVVDGCDCVELIKYDNLYAKICDEDTGESLWDMYWKNPVSGEVQAFVAKENVTDGRNMRGTYCPEHLHLYHLLCKWEDENDKVRLSSKSGMREMVKKGVSTVAVPISMVKKKDNTPQFLAKYEPFFKQLEQDSRQTSGISILHYQNPVSKMNDVTMVVFDLRIFQQELGQIDQNTQPSILDAVGKMGITLPNTPSVQQIEEESGPQLGQGQA
tara:strand:+ start:2289 stop:3272 length:984 start_codon:yes stop_codon:yes gene_type:complete